MLARSSRDGEVVSNLQLLVVSDGPIFSLAREKIGEKRALGYVWCMLRLSLGEPQCFGLAFHSVVTLRVSTTRRLIRYNGFVSSCG